MSAPDRSQRVAVAPGVELAVFEWDGDGTPFVLLHGLASNARLWDGVAATLAAAGHRVLAVDQRGHGQASKPDDGYDMATVTDDLHRLVGALGLERPVVAGQSWGANVVVEFAARFPGVAAAVACVDGGTIELAARFPDWDECATVLRPPPLAGTPLVDIERMIRQGHADWPESGIAGTLACFEVRDDGTVAPWLTLDRHLQVLRGLWEHRPHDRFPHIEEPVLFIPATGSSPSEAPAALADARVVPIDGDHDLHAQHPVRVAEVLRTLVETEEAP
ncbi:alpha/beta fold hydrolase [Actinospongicola halichondriae]|uniref:alpha/beta fold hydrolase n=1 Tax=Actinospongicola halichondriae TaxID=3236844 RepID=UPI003D442087